MDAYSVGFLTDPIRLAELAFYPDPSVRAAVAANTSTPAATLLRMALREHELPVIRNAVNNTSLTNAMKIPYVGRSYAFDYMAAESSLSDAALLDAIYRTTTDAMMLGSIGRNSSASVSTLDAIIKNQALPSTVRVYAVSNPNAPMDSLEWVARHGDDYLKAVARKQLKNLVH